MLGNFIKIAWRNLCRHKLYALINVGGLALGLAACLLIALYVHYEFSHDDFVLDRDRVYRLSANFEASALGPARRAAGNVAPLVPLIDDNQLPGVQEAARIGGMDVVVALDEIAYTEQNLKWVDPTFFDIITLDWLQGSADSALSEPGSVVLSASAARRYFGNEDPMGRTLLLETSWPVQVTGVVADFPQNSHLEAGVFVSIAMAWNLLGFDYSNNWSYDNFHSYIKLEPGADIATVLEEIETAVVGENSRIDEAVAEFFNVRQGYFSLSAYPLSDLHFSADRVREFKEPGSKGQVLMFIVIAAGLLLIACINFINLGTARATQRAREVGLRKAIGAQRSSLIGQFLGESLLLCVVAMLLALVIAENLSSILGAALDRALSFSAVFEPDFLLFIAGITLVTGLLAGTYPAFYLTAFKPGRVFRADSLQSRGALGLRNVLVVFQFFIAITLIVAMLVVSLQMRFVQNTELGFRTDNILLLRGNSQAGLGAQWEAFKERILQFPDVVNVTEEGMSPVTGNNVGFRHVRIEGGSQDGYDIQTKPVGFNFFVTYDIPLVEGRLFNAQIASDVFTPPGNAAEGAALSAAYILNEAAARQLGLSPSEVLGRQFEIDFSNDFSLAVAGPVIGVVEDIHLQSLHEAILPVVYFVQPPRWGEAPGNVSASVRIDTSNSALTVSRIREAWEQYITEVPFTYRLLEVDIDSLYQREEREGQLFALFAFLTVLIACLGLFGLASFTVERRRKEIGVRKVVGGSVWQIVLLLTQDFSRLVLVANVLAWPVAYVAMNRWLEQFAYRIDLTPMIFVGSGLIALCVAWVTVGGTAAKAASQKPVLALRYE